MKTKLIDVDMDVYESLLSTGAKVNLKPEQVVRLLVEYASDKGLRVQPPRVLERKR